MSINMIYRLKTAHIPCPRQMDHLLHGHNYAKAAVDMAVYDAWGGDILAAACTHLGATDYFRINLPKGAGLGVVPDEAMFGAPVVEF